MGKLKNPKAKGIRTEGALIRLALDGGAHIGSRSPASVGAFDVAITALDGRRYLVNVKCNQWAPPHERARLARLARFPDIPVLARKDDRKPWLFRAVGKGGEMGEVSEVPPWT